MRRFFWFCWAIILQGSAVSGLQAQPYPLRDLVGDWIYVFHEPVTGPEGRLVFLRVQQAYMLQELYDQGEITRDALQAGGVYPRLQFGFAPLEGGKETLREYVGEWLEEEGIVRMEQDGLVAYYRPVQEDTRWVLYALDPQYGHPEAMPRFKKAQD
ncbi:MAG: hypothetical protein KF690_11880 [Bacteroidetes bacterium]|nr:hypothetical protein [Bacteroidota bacterium]